MKKLLTMIGIIASLGILFGTFSLFADDSQKFSDNIVMENKAYKERKKSTLTFPHGQHARELEIGCGECHHDENGEPLNDLKEGDSVTSCIKCHSIPGERPKGKGAPDLSKEERLEYHAEAIHYNCKDCHKKYNRKNKTKAAPATCNGCHPKEK